MCSPSWINVAGEQKTALELLLLLLLLRNKMSSGSGYRNELAICEKRREEERERASISRSSERPQWKCSPISPSDKLELALLVEIRAARLSASPPSRREIASGGFSLDCGEKLSLEAAREPG